MCVFSVTKVPYIHFIHSNTVDVVPIKCGEQLSSSTSSSLEVLIGFVM